MRYWYHPESDALWQSDEQEDARGDGTVVELSEEEYLEGLERAYWQIKKDVGT